MKEQPVAAWHETFRIRAYEADPEGLASMQTLCNYYQEAAGNHAHALKVSVEQLSEHRLAWVLARLHVQVGAYPAWGHTVTVETWPSGQNGLFATRDFLLHSEEGDVLSRATSAWLLIDVDRRRPIRLPEWMSAIREPARHRAVDDAFARLPVLRQPDHEQRFRIRYSDLDLNNHVNNVHYVEWAVETLPREQVEGYHLNALEMHFRTETTFGDTVLGQAEQDEHPDGLIFTHRLVRAADAREVALARTQWIAAEGR